LVEPEQQMVIVPDFIGVPIEKVPSMLPGNLGFQVNNPPIITGKVAIGAIAQQSPGKDQRVAPGTKIALTVEAESVEVPDLRGKQVGKAFDELNSKKLVPRYRDGDFAGKVAVLLPVAWQSPAPGTRVAPGTTITINAVP
ncbi:MAG TPA: PASTA domain-containing protein, partial [Terrimicrobiaceae bacterium]